MAISGATAIGQGPVTRGVVAGKIGFSRSGQSHCGEAGCGQSVARKRLLQITRYRLRALTGSGQISHRSTISRNSGQNVNLKFMKYAESLQRALIQGKRPQGPKKAGSTKV
jgi:hypothetical protein